MQEDYNCFCPFPVQVHRCGSVSVPGSRVPGQAGRAGGESLLWQRPHQAQKTDAAAENGQALTRINQEVSCLWTQMWSSSAAWRRPCKWSFIFYTFSFKLLCGWDSAVNASGERTSGAPDKCPVLCQDQVSAEPDMCPAGVTKNFQKPNSFLQDGSEGATEPKTTTVFGYQFRFRFRKIKIKIKIVFW